MHVAVSYYRVPHCSHHMAVFMWCGDSVKMATSPHVTSDRQNESPVYKASLGVAAIEPFDNEVSDDQPCE